MKNPTEMHDDVIATFHRRWAHELAHNSPATPMAEIRRRVEQADAKPAAKAGNGTAPDDARSAAGSSHKLAAVMLKDAADIEPERVEWLWPGRIARGKQTCIAGEPGTGKSQLTIAIAAAITTGGHWPCGEGRAPVGNVIILSAEDGAADTIIPRLMAAGADLSRVKIVEAVREVDGRRRSFTLQADIAALKAAIEEVGDVALVIMDPISSYLGKTDSHKNAEVRGVLEPLAEMAERTGTAILSVTHFSKAGSNSPSKAMHRFIGSIAFTAAARMAFAVIEDAEHEGRLLLLPVKNNLAPAPPGLAYRLEQAMVDEAKRIQASRIAFDSEPVTISANEAMAAEAEAIGGGGRQSARDEAEEFLRTVLADGPVPHKEVHEAAGGHGISWATVLRAKKRLRVISIRPGGVGPWLWQSPSPSPASVAASAKE